MTINNQKECLFSQVSDEIRHLNEMLLSVDWKAANLDVCCINKDNETSCAAFTEEQNELIRTIINYIPEWKRLIGCKQHNIHDYSLDFHTIAVVKNIQKQEAFEKLKKYEKLLVLYSALLHDIEKNENEVDAEHPVKGAKKSSSILYRLGFSEKFINSVYLLIRYHQILGLMASGKLHLSEDEIVEMFKKPILVDLQIILSIADIKSVKKDGSFYEEGLNEKFEKLKTEIKGLISKTAKI